MCVVIRLLFDTNLGDDINDDWIVASFHATFRLLADGVEQMKGCRLRNSVVFDEKHSIVGQMLFRTASAFYGFFSKFVFLVKRSYSNGFARHYATAEMIYQTIKRIISRRLSRHLQRTKDRHR